MAGDYDIVFEALEEQLDAIAAAQDATASTLDEQATAIAEIEELRQLSMELAESEPTFYMTAS